MQAWFREYLTMPVVPSNCMTRGDLHGIINRCEILSQSSLEDCQLYQGFRQLYQAACHLDGILADKGKEIREHPNHKGVFSDDWPTEWQDSGFSIHVASGVFSLYLGQQVLVRPSDKARIPTGRYRLIIGGEVYHDTKSQLRCLVVRYVERFKDVLPASVSEEFVNRFFSKEVEDHAV
jgi:hypothetical protein